MAISRRMIIPALAGMGSFGLVQCAAVPTIASIIAAVQSACGIVVVAEQLVQALAGVDLSKLNVTQFVQAICDQFTALQAQHAPTVPPPSSMAARDPAPMCYVLTINGKPVTACKS